VGQPQKPSPPRTRIFFLPLSAIISSTPARLVVVVLLGVLSMLLRASMPPGTTAGETLERRPAREMLGRETSGEGAMKASATPMAERKARAAAAGVGTYIVVSSSFLETETRCSFPSTKEIRRQAASTKVEAASSISKTRGTAVPNPYLKTDKSPTLSGISELPPASVTVSPHGLPRVQGGVFGGV